MFLLRFEDNFFIFVSCHDSRLNLYFAFCCRLFGTKCDKCSQCFSKNDYVMRAKTKIYHVECFRCSACMRRLETGDEFALRQDGLFCRHDHDALEGGKHCTGAIGIPGSENNNNASLTNNNHHLHPNDGSMSGEDTIFSQEDCLLFSTRPPHKSIHLRLIFSKDSRT